MRLTNTHLPLAETTGMTDITGVMSPTGMTGITGITGAGGLTYSLIPSTGHHLNQPQYQQSQHLQQPHQHEHQPQLQQQHVLQPQLRSNDSEGLNSSPEVHECTDNIPEEFNATSDYGNE